LIQIYRRVSCTTVGKLTTDTMNNFLNGKPLDKRERKREKSERDIMLLLLRTDEITNVKPPIYS
jgi:hypothetical protein